MKVFKLQELESHMPDDILLRAEVLHQGGKVGPLTEVERHLWVATVADRKQYEVEVQITPSKVRSVSCECSTYGEKGVCRHIGAVMLELRRERNRRREVREAKKAERAALAAQRSPRLTLDSVLEGVPPEDLRAFVKEYAGNHRQFSIALKARFMPQVEHIKSSDKYAQLLQSAISAARKTDRRISLRGVQKLSKVLEEVTTQASGYYYAGYYPEVVSTAGSVLERITPILSKIDRGRDKIEDYLHQAFALLRKVAEGPAPPAVKQKLWDYAMGESKKLFYRNQQWDVPFFRLLLLLADNGERRQSLLEHVEEHLELRVATVAVQEDLLLIKLHLLEKLEDQPAITEFFHEHIRNPHILKRAIHYARRHGDMRTVHQWIRIVLQSGEMGELEVAWKKMALEVAREMEDRTEIAELALDLFLITGKDRYFTLALEHGKDRDALVDEALQQLALKNRRPQRQRAIAVVLSAAGRHDNLLEFLRQAGSLELVQEFDHHWIGNASPSDALSEVYRDLVMDYLKDHVGRGTSQKIRSTVEHLQAVGYEQLAEELVTEMRAAFPERHSLMEELEIF